MKTKKIAIIQSNYIPWKGYFDMIGLADEFIIYDEVQYTKNDWRNRNRIKTLSGLEWITIPVYQKSLKQKISETEISNFKWGHKNWNMLKTNYSKAPFFKDYSIQLEEFYTSTKSVLLSEINFLFIKMICEWIGIETLLSNSVNYVLQGNPSEKLVSLCKQAGASIYLSGPAAKSYLQTDLFEKEGIEIEWMDYSGYLEYPQQNPPFVHQVTILDLLFNTGENSIHYMKCGKV